MHVNLVSRLQMQSLTTQMRQNWWKPMYLMYSAAGFFVRGESRCSEGLVCDECISLWHVLSLQSYLGHICAYTYNGRTLLNTLYFTYCIDFG
jgi:hypothetical protein